MTELVRLHADPVVMETMGGSWASSRTEEWIERQIQLQRHWGHGVWLAYTTPDNAASRRVAEKAGFAYERDFLEGDARRVLYRRLAS